MEITIDHIIEIVKILAPYLLGAGGLLWWILGRIDRKQKRQIEESKKAVSLMQKVETKLDTLDTISQEVSDHTTTLQGFGDRLIQMEGNQARIEENQQALADKIANLSDGEKATLRRSLRSRYDIFQRQGFITPEQKSDWKKDFKVYSSLGGNGEIAVYDTIVDKLPVRTDTKRGWRKKL